MMSEAESTDEKWVKPMLMSIADQPVLWDDRHEGFKNKKGRERAWSVVVAKVKKQSGIVKSREAIIKRFKALKDCYLKQRQNKSGGMSKNKKYGPYLTFLDRNPPIIDRPVASFRRQARRPKVTTSLLSSTPAEKALAEYMSAMPTDKLEQHQRYQALKEEYDNLLTTEAAYQHDWYEINSEQEHMTNKSDRSNASARKSRVNAKLQQAALRREKIVWEMAVLCKMMDSSNDDEDENENENMEIEGSEQRPSSPDTRSLLDVESLQDVNLLQPDLTHYGWPEDHGDDDSRQKSLEQLVALPTEPISRETLTMQQHLYVLVKRRKELMMAKTSTERAMQATTDYQQKPELTLIRRQNAAIENELVKIELQIDIAVKDIEIERLRDTLKSREKEISRLKAEAFQTSARLRFQRDDPREENDEDNNYKPQEFSNGGRVGFLERHQD